MIRKSTFAAKIAKLFGMAAVAATLCAAPAHAGVSGVLDFEGYADNIVMDGLGIVMGDYYLETTGGGFGLIGNNDSCSAIMACPANNATTYYASLSDDYAFIEMADHSAFKLGSIDASFLGFNGTTYPSPVAGLLRVTAFNTVAQVGTEIFLNLAGPVNGVFNFATYDLSALNGVSGYNTIRLVAYACEVGSINCNRTTNQAQFALDNVAFVPEPGSFALMGLGLFGIGAIARRRKVAAI